MNRWEKKKKKIKLNHLRKKTKIKILNYSKKYSKKEELLKKIPFESVALNYLVKKNFLKRSKIKDEKIEIKIPSKFSIIENPDEVFEVIKKSIWSYEKEDIKIIKYDFSNCEKIDLGAIILQNVICLNLEKNKKILEGNFPNEKNIEALIMVKDSGLYDICTSNKEMNSQIDNEDEKEQEKKYSLKFPLHSGGKQQKDIKCKEAKKGQIEGKITDYLNTCLKENGYYLLEEGEEYFDKIIGEIISNCIDHSIELEQFFCMGHTHKVSEDVCRFQLSFFNFGQTISQGLENSKQVNEKVKKEIKELIEIHTTKFYDNWNRNTLLTLYSLQGLVTRLYDKEITRGTGTITFLNAFRSISGTIKTNYVPKMSIISGNSQIIIDNSEICKIFNDKITFNEERSLKIAPNKKYVRNIKNNFPGTIIVLDLYLDEKWIKMNRKGN